MELWRMVYDPETGRHRHRTESDFGHALLAPFAANIFQTLGVSASIPPSCSVKCGPRSKTHPAPFGVVSDGLSLFVTNDYTDKPFWTASLRAPTVWTNMDSPNVGRRSDRWVLDPDHHLVYSANLVGGLWRLRTQ